MTVTVLKVLRFRYSDLKQLLLKAYILTRFGAFLFIFDDHMLIGEQKMKTKYHRTFPCGGVVLAVLNLHTKNLSQ